MWGRYNLTRLIESKYLSLVFCSIALSDHWRPSCNLERKCSTCDRCFVPFQVSPVYIVYSKFSKIPQAHIELNTKLNAFFGGGFLSSTTFLAMIDCFFLKSSPFSHRKKHGPFIEPCSLLVGTAALQTGGWMETTATKELLAILGGTWGSRSMVQKISGKNWGQTPYVGGGHLTFNRNPYNGYINPYYWVDEFIPYYMEIMGV